MDDLKEKNHELRELLKQAREQSEQARRIAMEEAKATVINQLNSIGMVLQANRTGDTESAEAMITLATTSTGPLQQNKKARVLKSDEDEDEEDQDEEDQDEDEEEILERIVESMVWKRETRVGNEVFVTVLVGTTSDDDDDCTYTVSTLREYKDQQHVRFNAHDRKWYSGKHVLVTRDSMCPLALVPLPQEGQATNVSLRSGVYRATCLFVDVTDEKWDAEGGHANNKRKH